MDYKAKQKHLIFKKIKKVQQRTFQMMKMKTKLRKESRQKKEIQTWKILMMRSKLFYKDNSLKQLLEQLLSNTQVVLMLNSFKLFHLNLSMFSNSILLPQLSKTSVNQLKMIKLSDLRTRCSRSILMILEKCLTSSQARLETSQTIEKMLQFKFMSYLSFSEKQIYWMQKLMIFNLKMLLI